MRRSTRRGTECCHARLHRFVRDCGEGVSSFTLYKLPSKVLHEIHVLTHIYIFYEGHLMLTLCIEKRSLWEVLKNSLLDFHTVLASRGIIYIDPYYVRT